MRSGWAVLDVLIGQDHCSWNNCSWNKDASSVVAVVAVTAC